MKLVVYSYDNEVLITTEEDEDKLLAEWFDESSGRDFEDYEIETYEGVVEVNVNCVVSGEKKACTCGAKE